MSYDRASPPARADALVPVPDLAGTPAADAHGRFFGEVYGALADADSGLIRYLDFDVHGAGRHVLVPIGHVRVAREGEPSSGVRLRAASADDLRTIPPYEPHPAGAPGPDEAAVLAAHGRFFAGERYYAHPAFDHSGLYAGARPIVRARSASGGGEDADGSRLMPLSALTQYELAEGEPEVRGWPLVTRDGARPGVVEDLVVEPAALQARYLALRLGAGRLVLVPIGYAELDREGHAVRTPALAAQDIEALPPVAGAIERSDEEAVRAVLDARLDGPRRYDRPDFRASRAGGGLR